MKAVVAAFNQEKALVASRGLLRDYEPSDLLRMELFEALLSAVIRSLAAIARLKHEAGDVSYSFDNLHSSVTPYRLLARLVVLASDTEHRDQATDTLRFRTVNETLPKFHNIRRGLFFVESDH